MPLELYSPNRLGIPQEFQDLEEFNHAPQIILA
jgi:hypothetical protein